MGKSGAKCEFFTDFFGFFKGFPQRAIREGMKSAGYEDVRRRMARGRGGSFRGSLKKYVNYIIT